METRPLDANRIRETLTSLLATLEGEWLLVGGALAALWFDERRVTEDLDLVGMSQTPQERYTLLDRVCRMGLPVETVNSAADYFVYRVAGWREHVEPFMRGARAALFRPTPELFLVLKAGRLSERDFEDCRLLVQWCGREARSIDATWIRRALALLPPAAGAGANARREQLFRLLAPRRKSGPRARPRRVTRPRTRASARATKGHKSRPGRAARRGLA